MRSSLTSDIAIGSGVTVIWLAVNGKLEGRAIDLSALSSAEVLLMVRRWWGRMSALSSEARESMSERGMPSSPSTCPGPDLLVPLPSLLLSLSLSLPKTSTVQI